MATSIRRHRRLKIAAANNAAWCDAMCRSHGHAGTFTPQAWLSSHRTPELYPDAVTLAADAAADLVLAGIDTSSGCSVKDSFAVTAWAEAWCGTDEPRDVFRPSLVADPDVVGPLVVWLHR